MPELQKGEIVTTQEFNQQIDREKFEAALPEGAILGLGSQCLVNFGGGKIKTVEDVVEALENAGFEIKKTIPRDPESVRARVMANFWQKFLA
jgi:hypothetical protein